MKSTPIVLLASTLFLATTPVMADEAQSRAYFETGAKAYEKGDYQNAIRAFEQAYALTKRAGLIFSIAQSYKRQYAVDSNSTNLRKSLEYYRRFIAEDKSGKRRGDATASIMEVEAILSRLPADQQDTAVQAPEAPPEPTQISVTTQVDDATISIDGGPPRTLEPVEVKTGKHKVVIQAPGYFPEERELYAAEKQMTAIDVPLRPMPAKVTVEGRVGSTVTVDGSPRGALPLLAPLEIEAGEHTLAVSQSGFVTFSRESTFKRGQESKINADLSRTKQRIGSFVLFGTSAIFAGGGVLAALGSAGAYAGGIQLSNQQKTGNRGYMTAEELETYNIFKEQQTQANVLTAVSFNLAAATGALAFLLYYFDDPKLPSPKPKKDDKAPAPKDQSPGMRDMMLLPVTSPGFAGVTFGARF